MTAIALLLAILPACLDAHPWQAREKPWSSGTVADQDEVRIALADGSVLIMARPGFGNDDHGDFLRGSIASSKSAPRAASNPTAESNPVGKSGPATWTGTESTRKVYLSDVTRLETHGNDRPRAALNAVAAAILATVVLAAVVLAYSNQYFGWPRIR